MANRSILERTPASVFLAAAAVVMMVGIVQHYVEVTRIEGSRLAQERRDEQIHHECDLGERSFKMSDGSTYYTATGTLWKVNEWDPGRPDYCAGTLLPLGAYRDLLKHLAEQPIP